MLTINQCREYLPRELTDTEVEVIRESVYAFVQYALDKVPELGMLEYINEIN